MKVSFKDQRLHNDQNENSIEIKQVKAKGFLMTILGTISLMVSAHAQETPIESDTPIYELSPFEVSVSENVGYLATSSLAGTRINSDLRDLGAAISVITKEFIEDTGVTSIDELLVYTTGTEVGGAYGNFTNSSTSVGRALQQSNRSNPEGNTRIRGLVSAETSRDFFITDFGFDSFNVERVDISRGPNSILFGVGSPGGVIDYSMKRPNLSNSRNEVSVRIGQRGSHRETGDFNAVLIEDRLAVRLNVLNETTNFRQEPAYENDQRIHGAIEGILFENKQSNFLGTTKIKGNFEVAELKTTPPNVIAPTDNIRHWYNAPNVAAIEAQTGRTAPSRYTDGSFVSQALHDKFGANDPFMGSLARRLPYFIAIAPIYNHPINGNPPNIGFSNPALADIQAAEGRVQGSRAFDWLMQSNLVEEAWTSGFTAQTFQNTDIYDFKNQLITGTLESRQDDFENISISLEQLFLENKAGLEFSYNRQSLDRRTVFPFSTAGLPRSGDVWVDNNLWLGNGEPNPNVGRPFMISRAWGNHALSEIDRNTSRVTGFYNLDFREMLDGDVGKWLGRHVFSGIAERAEREILNRDWRMAVSSDEINMQTALNGLKNSQRRQLHAGFYVGPDLRGVGSYNDVRLDGFIDVDPITPQNGYSFKTFIRDPATDTIRNVTAYADEFLNSGSASKRIIDTEAITLQSYLLDDYVVALYGYRSDHVRDTLNVGGGRLADGAFDPENLILKDSPDLDAKGDTSTFSIVVHLPEEYLFELPFGADLSVFWSESENFQPTGFRQDVFLNSIAPPNGETTEKGFNLSFMENRYNFRVNWFETKNSNISLAGNLATGATNTISQWLNTYLEAKRLEVPFGFAANGNPTGIDQYYDNYDEVIQTLLDLVPEPLKAARNLRVEGAGVGLDNVEQDPVPGLASTSSFVAEGVEVEFIANPTDRWRISMNVAKQETVQSGSGAELQAYYSQIRQSLVDANLWDTDVSDNPSTTGDTTFKQRLTRDFLNPLASVAAKDGTASQEQRKWRANLVTAYQFTEGGFLKGFEIGGALRWQDKAAVGYPIILVESEGDVLQQPNLSSPYFAPSSINGDIFARYRKRLSDRIDWTVQLNLRNLIGDQDLIPEVINPDGSNAVMRIPVERAIFLTNTFEF
ncbi:MAG: TonB-dependent receptor plug domain-containing protein [Verrucomicrobia bacterium]|nr:TonB-dependent receptor plug domain-containing protein [Verrucomicrobiota bacterium]